MAWLETEWALVQPRNGFVAFYCVFFSSPFPLGKRKNNFSRFSLLSPPPTCDCWPHEQVWTLIEFRGESRSSGSDNFLWFQQGFWSKLKLSSHKIWTQTSINDFLPLKVTSQLMRERRASHEKKRPNDERPSRLMRAPHLRADTSEKLHWGVVSKRVKATEMKSRNSL